MRDAVVGGLLDLLDADRAAAGVRTYLDRPVLSGLPMSGLAGHCQCLVVGSRAMPCCAARAAAMSGWTVASSRRTLTGS